MGLYRTFQAPPPVAAAAAFDPAIRLRSWDSQCIETHGSQDSHFTYPAGTNQVTNGTRNCQRESARIADKSEVSKNC